MGAEFSNKGLEELAGELTDLYAVVGKMAACVRLVARVGPEHVTMIGPIGRESQRLVQAFLNSEFLRLNLPQLEIGIEPHYSGHSQVVVKCRWRQLEQPGDKTGEQERMREQKRLDAQTRRPKGG